MSELAHKKIALLLMAAGESSRLGQPKQLIEIAETQQQPQSFLRRQIKLMNSICLSTNAKAYCVLGCQSERLIKHLNGFSPARNLTVINNSSWSQGLSTSIAKGVSALSEDVSGVLIFFVDQWQLTDEDIMTLIHKWHQQPKKIFIASTDKNISPPVIFPRFYFNALIKLTGDDGAKKVIKENMSQVNLCEMPSAFVDLDTPEDLTLFNER